MMIFMRGKWPIAALASSLLVGSLAQAQAPRSTVLPGVGAQDPRRTIDITQAPWTSLARLQIPGVSRCTAVLIGPNLALTAAHCLYGERLGHFVAPGSVHVLTGYANGAFARHSLASAIHIAPGFDPAHVDQTRGADFALVVLAEPLGTQPLGFSAAGPTDQIALGGYSQDRAEVIAADRDCRVNGRTADGGGRALLVHGCTATRGTSGAPLLMRDSDGVWRIVGLEVGARAGVAGGIAIPATSLQALVARLSA